MPNERMTILKMLEEGKITAESASKLLASINEEGGAPRSEGADGREFGSQTNPYEKRIPEGRKETPGWASELGRKIEVVAKDLEPKIQKLAGTVFEKSVEIADAATKSIHGARERNAERSERERGSRADSGAYGAQRPGSEIYGIPREAAKASGGKSFELSVSPDLPNEMILKSPKGGISIKGYNGDKVTVNVSASERFKGAEIDFLKLGCVYQLHYDADAFERIILDVYVPFAMFKRLTVETEDGDVSIDGVEAGTFDINTTKCYVSVKNVKADRLRVDNIDGAVILSNLNGVELLVENANGTIDAVNTDFKTLKLETTAEPVSVISQGFYKHSSYEWLIRTSNARLKASLPVSADLGYDLKAYTSLSDVSNGLSGINYTTNERNCIEGKSEDFEMKPKKARIVLDTSNAPLYIN